MTRTSLLAGRFLRDRKAATAVIFALGALPSGLAVGAAVDYSRAAALQTRLQAATDAAALAVGGAAPDMTDTQLSARATQEFQALMRGQDGNPRISQASPIAVSAGRTKVTITTQVDFAPYMLRLDTGMTLTATSSTELSNLNYEIALVFDNSGSMADSAGGKSKMDAAKAAAASLVDTMFGSDRSAKRTKMALVPFTLSVNAGKDALGKDYSTAAWVDTKGKSSIHWQNLDRTGATWQPASRLDVYKELGITWSGCFETRPGDFGVNDTAGTSGTSDSLFVPMFAPDEPGPQPASTSTSQKYYIGTGTSKAPSSGSQTNYTYDNNYLDDNGGACTTTTASTDTTKRQAQICKYKIGGNTSKRLDAGATRGPNRSCDARPLMRLSSNASDIKDAISKMVASGNTNLLEGLAWGWRTISPNTPFADGQPYSDGKTQKIIILMTDGQNAWNSASNPNKSIYAPFGYYINNRFAPATFTDATKAADAMDTGTLSACTNAKNVGVRIYTVGFSVKSGDVDTALLQKCATSATTAYIAQNATQIQSVFQEIAASLGTLRLTQ